MKHIYCCGILLQLIQSTRQLLKLQVSAIYSEQPGQAHQTSPFAVTRNYNAVHSQVNLHNVGFFSYCIISKLGMLSLINWQR